MVIASDEYQTPKKYIKAAIKVMESIDLDPACSKVNYERLKGLIENYFYKDLYDDGLHLEWYGNIWCNPPYSKPNLSHWTNKLIKEWSEGIGRIKQVIYLVPSYTSEQWYQKSLYNCSAFCLPNHRIKHLIDGKIQVSPRFSSTFFYFGLDTTKFLEIFSKFGQVFFHPSLS